MKGLSQHKLVLIAINNFLHYKISGTSKKLKKTSHIT
jgi:hypothetical protein